MSQSYYSWCGTKLHFLLDDNLAAAYNRAYDKFEAAQQSHLETFGSPWNPRNYLLMNWSDEESHAWNKIARMINTLVEINGGTLGITEEECTSNHLIKL